MKTVKALINFRLTSFAITLIALIAIPTAIAGRNSVISGAIIQAHWCGQSDYICLFFTYAKISAFAVAFCFVLDLGINKWFLNNKKSKKSLSRKITEDSLPNIKFKFDIFNPADNSEDKRVGIWVDSPIHENVENLHIELKELFWIKTDNPKIPIMDWFSMANRTFETSNVPDIKSPLLFGHPRLVYLADTKEHLLVLLLRKNQIIDDMYEELGKEDLSKSGNYAVNYCKFELGLIISGTLGGYPTVSKPYSVIIEFKQTITRSFLDRGSLITPNIPMESIDLEIRKA
jgi:hypothetical protein